MNKGTIKEANHHLPSSPDQPLINFIVQHECFLKDIFPVPHIFPPDSLISKGNIQI